MRNSMQEPVKLTKTIIMDYYYYEIKFRLKSSIITISRCFKT